MVCAKCGRTTDNNERYCRACGVDLFNHSLAPQNLSAFNKTTPGLLAKPDKDPDELMGNGIGSVIMGDGFMMVGVLLSVVESSISSMLWLLLLIPAFILFGKGFADVLQAKQIRRRLQEQKHDLFPNESIPASISNSGAGDLVGRPSVTDRTTRQLK